MERHGRRTTEDGSQARVGGHATFHCSLSTVHCPLFTVQCPLSTVHCSLSTVHSRATDYNSEPTLRSPCFSARSLSSSAKTSRMKFVLLTMLRTTGNSFSDVENSKVPLLISIISRNAAWPLCPLHSASTILPSLNETLAR